MLCKRHPKQRMEWTGRRARDGEPIQHCPACTERVRAKLAPLLGSARGDKPDKQTVLPPVRMPWY